MTRVCAAVLGALVALCALSLQPAQAIPAGFTGWLNSWDGELNYKCPGHQVFTGIYSVHSNSKEDRLWAVRCGTVNDISSIDWTSYFINDWDAPFTYTCAYGHSLYWLRSVHSNSKEDRLWQAGCAKHTTSTITLTSCTWTNYLNDWDQPLDWRPSAPITLAGYGGYHDNGKEDRRWRVRHCSVSCQSPWYISGYKCYCPSGHFVSGSACTKWRLCQRGQYQSQSPTSSNDRGCSSCGTGTYRSQSDHTYTSCSLCSRGSYQSRTGQSSCDPCPSSTYQDQSGQASCKDCTDGYYRKYSYQQNKCEAGYRCPGSCARYACSAGTYQSLTGQQFCHACGHGKYQPSTGQSTCNSASTGYYVSSATAQTRCQPGYYCVDGHRYACTGENYQDQYGQTSCDTATLCTAGTYQRSAPTSTTNRVCSSCSLGSTYQDAGSHTYTTCKSTRTCTAGYYVVTKPTLSSNRHCGACPPNSFSTSNNAASCTQHSHCGAGQYVASRTSTSNTDCKSCVAGATYQDATQHYATSCKSLSATCAAGTYESVSPTVSNNRVCSKCPSGTYSSAGSTGCKSWTVCAVGYYESKAPTATSDRQCSLCNGKTQYQDQAGQTSCKPVTTCSSSQYETKAPTRSSNRQCTACRTTCSTGQVLQGTCGGTSNPYCVSCHVSCATCSGTSSSQCTSCSGGLKLIGGTCVDVACGSGQYATGTGCKACHSSCGDCDGGTPTDCTGCKAGTFLSGSACVSTCPANFFKDSSDNTCKRCTICPSGTFAPKCSGSTTADSDCQSWDVCDAGQKQKTEPNAYSDRVCVSCALGVEFQDTPGNVNCDPLTTCQAGYFVSAAPTTSTDRGCATCSAGKFANTLNQAKCQPCPAGTSQPNGGSPSCADCGLGFYQPKQGSTTCAEIPAGSYGVGGSVSTRTGVLTCPAGSYCEGGAAPARLCPAGTYQPQTGQSSCINVKVCGEGEFEKSPPTRYADRVCAACPSGSYQDDESHTDDSCIPWTTCPSGSYVSTAPSDTNDRECTPCQSPATYQSQSNQKTCLATKTCSPGSAETRSPTPSTDRVCTACKLGQTYQPNAGQTSCIAASVCQPGSYQTAAATLTTDAKCTSCTAGSDFTSLAGQTSCTKLSTCGAGQKQVQAPTLASDRICGSCDAGTYQDATSHTSVSCKPVTVCAAGYVTIKAATSSSDAVCQKCVAGSTWSEKGDTVCRKVFMCGAGERETSAPTISTDRTCTACSEGTFISATSHAKDACATWSTCPAGTFILSEGSTSADRQCDSCDGVETYQNLANQDACKPITACTTLEYQFTSPTALRDRECRTCTTASSCNSQEYLAGTCGGSSGTENPRCAACHPTCATCTGPNANQCKSCTDGLNLRGTTCVNECPDGEYDAGTSCASCSASCATCFGPGDSHCLSCTGSTALDTSSASCVATCPSGTFKNGNRCDKCTQCPDGEFASTKCSATADAVCSDWKVCQAGSYQSTAGTHLSDAKCTACTEGESYQPQSGQTACLETTTCSFPKIETVEPSLTTDRICSCDTLTCTKIVNDIFEEHVCAEPDDDQLQEYLGLCCAGITKESITLSIQLSDAYKARHSCDGCTDTCDCTAGFKLVTDQDSSECVSCVEGTSFNPTEGETSCLPVSKCGRGTQELAAPTISTDRQCADCPAGTTDADFSGATTCKECGPGTYAPAQSSGPCSNLACDVGTVDTDSDASTPCEPCTLGVGFQDQTGQTACKPVTSCAAGEEEVRAMTLFADRVCKECVPGTFKSEAGQEHKCQAVTVCQAGFEESQAPTATSDRLCRACAEDTFKPEVGSTTVCRAVTTCAAGEEEITAPTSKSDRICRSCLLGASFKADAGQDTTCIPVTRCTASEFMSQTPTVSSDAVCTDVTICADGFFEAEAPTSNSDRVCSECSVCPDGRFEIRSCSRLEDTQCAGCSACGPTEYMSAPCSDSDTQCQKCSSCAPSEFAFTPCGLTQDTDCRALSSCSGTEFELIPPTPTSDRLCKTASVCVGDEYEYRVKTTTSDRVCTPRTVCDPGEEALASSLADDENRVCTPCPAGSTDHDANGKSLCRECPPGTFVPTGSIGACSNFLCDSGYADTDRNSSTPCERCEVGVNFADEVGATACTPVTPCADGYAISSRATVRQDFQCSPCVLGLTFSSGGAPCALAKVCGRDQYQTAPPTLSTDTQCASLSQCGESQYVAVPATATSDRTCEDWSDCAPGQFEFAKPTAETDRVCFTPRVCADEEYEFVAPTATTDRQCAAVSTCGFQEYELEPPTTTTNRVCVTGDSTVLVFPASYYRLLPDIDEEKAFKQELLDLFANNSINIDSIADIRLSEGSVIAEVVAFERTVALQIWDMMLAGNITIFGFTAGPCEKDEFLDDSDPNPFKRVVCEGLSECKSYEFISAAETFTSDRICDLVTECTVFEDELEPPTPTSDRVCVPQVIAPTNATDTSTGKQGLSGGSMAIIIVGAVLVLLILVVFLVWNQRKRTKDERDAAVMERFQSSLVAHDDISSGNTLLRQLSTKNRSVLLFDNPTFADPSGGPVQPSWYQGQMTRAEAEQYVLANSGNVGDFVVRESSSNGNFVLTMLIGPNTFEHHKLYKNARGCFLVNGHSPRIECTTLDTLIDHLAQHKDGTTVLLNMQQDEMYGQTPLAGDQDMYGQAPAIEEPDFYGAVDKETPMWLKGPMDRKEAEAVLMSDPTPGHFLVRESKTRPGDYAVSLVLSGGRFEHHVLRQNAHGVFVINDQPTTVPCRTLPELVTHLQQNEECMSIKLKPDAPAPFAAPAIPSVVPSSFTNPGYASQGPARLEVNPGYQEPADGPPPPRPPKTGGDRVDFFDAPTFDIQT
eukprot:m.92811 g.92811  ORF g.92811 m.92811 type:complete len:2840 (+) comp12991_c0_seq1:76-8595(+)